MAGVAEHEPVLLQEVLAGLSIRGDGIYLDATFGRGGHSRRILDRLDPRGRVYALDRDPDALEAGRRLADEVSSPQLDQAERGFGFMRDGPLDMRMDPTSGESAAQWLARADEREIADVLWQFGEERQSRRIARAIVADRDVTPFTRTRQLAELIARVCKRQHAGDKHPATRSFQAIRIHVNRELESLDAALAVAPELLAAGGRLVVISFHSLEDRRVKRFIRQAERGPVVPRGLPPPTGWRPRLHSIGPAQRAAQDEVGRNPRARSAVLRVAERPA